MFEEGTLVEYCKGVHVIVHAEQLPLIIPPEVDTSKPVFLSGLTANWAVAEIALCYSRVCPAVYLYRPEGKHYICVFSRSDEFRVGTVKIDALPNPDY